MAGEEAGAIGKSAERGEGVEQDVGVAPTAVGNDEALHQRQPVELFEQRGKIKEHGSPRVAGTAGRDSGYAFSLKAPKPIKR